MTARNAAEGRAASGTMAQMRITGQVLGVAAGGEILANRVPYHVGELAGRMSDGLLGRDALYFAAALCVVGALASLVRGGRKQSASPQEDTPREPSEANGRVEERRVMTKADASAAYRKGNKGEETT